MSEETCSTQSGCCETKPQAAAEECCSTQSCCSNPEETALKLWTRAFFEALREVHKDVLKAKIQKAWGAKLDKGADAVLEAMEAHWHSSITQAKAKSDLREKLAAIQRESRK